MQTPETELALSDSEIYVLRLIGGGDEPDFDWLALQRLKQFGLVEDRPRGPVLTEAGKEALRKLGSALEG